MYKRQASISTNANRFSENVTGYDKNGNIKSLQRYGQTGASAVSYTHLDVYKRQAYLLTVRDL